MRESRRKFIWLLAASGSLLGWRPRTRAAQQPSAPPRTGFPGEKEPEAKEHKPSTKRVLEENQKDIKKSVERLYDLAAELKAEVEKTDSTEILSLRLVNKAEEIEKLARQIKNRAKG